ncbi:MAG: twin-arginine translocation signal domain-containing protein [Fuerstiella sp.]|nr:twin-arginine translocation signal domain-containing protein [Fuerstiella sp.]MCP4853798.1 twin-arginine translocation signal domain-containing protein [Fuerstiella sp.]
MTMQHEPLRPPRTERRGFLKSSAIGAATLAGLSLSCGAYAADGSDTLAFVADGKQFPFDTGSLKGVLRPQGNSSGITSVVNAARGATVSRSLGLFTHYRLLEAAKRHGTSARERSSESRLLADGTVEATWAADENHPFELKAVYRWAAPDVLDVVTSVTARKDLTGFEVFLSSYFEGFGESWVYAKDAGLAAGKPPFVQATRDKGVWQMFPRDKQAAEMIGDGRWKQPPHPVDWAIRPTLAGPLGMRIDRKTGLVALVMAPPEDCFAISTPFGTEGHRSLYLSLFGQDFKLGQTKAACSRLVVRPGVSFEDAVRIYTEYLKECNEAVDQ